ncbi:hypothetical protein [Fictibacillus sp. UD]|uniref:hypothetical protein n=1 Tax=Fictibacillus sp. UD TaxID=3038777 RepID=UPI00374877BC
MEDARLLRDKRSGETLYGAKRQGAHRLPRGKRASGTEINYFHSSVVELSISSLNNFG